MRYTILILSLISFSVLTFGADTKTPPAPSPTPTPTPVQKPTPAPIKATADNYTIPLYFEPKPNGVNVLDQALEYSLSGNELTIGKTNFNSSTIKYELHKDEKGVDYIIKFSWPAGFLTQGKLLMRTNVEKKTLYSIEKISSGVIAGDTFSIEGKITEKEVNAWDKQTPLKFCVDDLENKKSFCSQDYIIRDVHEGVNLRTSRQEYKSEVVLNTEHQDNKGKFRIKYGSTLVAKIVFKNGAEYDFETQPVPFEPTDIVENADHKIVFKAKGGLPYGGDKKNEADNWVTKMDKETPHIYMNTKNEVVLRQDFEVTRMLPQEKLRPRLRTGSRDSSYRTHVPLHGYEPEKVKVTSQEFNVETTGENSFNWDFQNETEGNVNRSHIKLLADNQEFVSYYDVYKGYPIELSGRFTGAFGQNGALILGELLATGWLEQFFGNENQTFSLQHWGASARYLKSITSPSDSNGQAMTLQSINVDAKYRFTPGIWNQQESFGALLAYQNLTFESQQVSMAGVGAFWVRPMPSLVDKLFNKIKWFRYPKVIDAEIEWYPMSMTSGTTIGTNFNAIVHGKLFVKPTFFVEAALGMKQYNYSQANTFTAQITTTFLSGGVGWDF